MPSLATMPASLMCEIFELVCAEGDDTALESAMERPALALELALLGRAFMEPGLQVALADVRSMRAEGARALAVSLKGHPARARWIRTVFVAVECGDSADGPTASEQLAGDLGVVIGSALALRNLALAVNAAVLVGLAPAVSEAGAARTYPYLGHLVIGMADPLSATVQHALIALASAFGSTLVELTINAENASFDDLDLPALTAFPHPRSIKLMSCLPLSLVLAFANAASTLRDLTIGHGHNFLTALDPAIAARVTTITMLNMHRDEPALTEASFHSYGALEHLAVAGHRMVQEHLDRLPRSLISLESAWSAQPDDLLAFVEDRSVSPSLAALRFHGGLRDYEEPVAASWLDSVRRLGDACEQRGIVVDIDIAEAGSELVRMQPCRSR